MVESLRSKPQKPRGIQVNCYVIKQDCHGVYFKLRLEDMQVEFLPWHMVEGITYHPAHICNSATGENK